MSDAVSRISALETATALQVAVDANLSDTLAAVFGSLTALQAVSSSLASRMDAVEANARLLDSLVVSPPMPPAPSPPPPKPPGPPPRPSPPPPQPPPPSDPVCFQSYTNISDTTREILHGGGDYCDWDGGNYYGMDTPSPSTLDSGVWYRFFDVNGYNFIPSYSPGDNHCGTQLTGCISSHPTFLQGVISASLSYYYYGSVSVTQPVSVVQCPGYFLYNFGTPSNWGFCNKRVCTTDLAPSTFGI